MGIDAKEKTAHNTSVGADAGQSIQNDSDNSIPTSGTKRNGKMETPAENLEEMYRKIQRKEQVVAHGVAEGQRHPHHGQQHIAVAQKAGENTANVVRPQAHVQL